MPCIDHDGLEGKKGCAICAYIKLKEELEEVKKKMKYWRDERNKHVYDCLDRLAIEHKALELAVSFIATNVDRGEHYTMEYFYKKAKEEK